MLGEAIAAALVGAAALWLVLQPVFVPPPPEPPAFEPPDPEETATGVALTALKEIEFDRETGKLSDADYDLLKSRYTSAALEALRAADPEAMIAARVQALRSASIPGSVDVPVCRSCGPRPEPDAGFCSNCGQRLSPGPACERCGTSLAPDSRFCEGCGRRVAA